MDITIGPEVIKEFLVNTPNKPGVYRMLDNKHNVLYVGKAKNLANRISNYTQVNNLSNRIRVMVNQTASMEILICETEKEALLLEANLIKSLKPKFNILLKDDKTFPYILIREDHNFGQIIKHRGEKKNKGKYFGPFASVLHVNKVIDYIQKIFLLRPCSDNYFSSRKRPCVQYEIKKCSAPCVNKITKDDYNNCLDQAKNFMSGKCNNIQKEIAKQMENASNNMEYEKAAEYRDRIVALNNIQSSQNITTNIKDSDFIAIALEGSFCCIQIFFIRGGQNFGNKAYFPEQIEEMKEEEILSLFIANFYQHTNAPKEILVSHIINNKKELEEAFKVKIAIPKAGDKKTIMDFAIQNTLSALARKLTEYDKQKYLLDEVQKTFGLTHKIKRIDVFDNSHISGKFPIGAMIVSTDEGFTKKHYRLFDILSTDKGDDYEMLKEVLSRRYSRMLKEYKEYTEYSWPDLIIIDGGPGHLSIAKSVFEKLEINIPYICIAKGDKRNAGGESFYRIEKPVFTLPNDNHVMQYIQRLRDEAHRFAITSHRKKRSTNTIKSLLTDIPNIGKQRKKQLLQHFGSAKEVENASIKELQQVEGISSKIAVQIYDYLQSRSRTY